jgi:MinD superfamily P-loop ATPase
MRANGSKVRRDNMHGLLLREIGERQDSEIKVLTLIRERMNFDVVIEVNKNGDITQVLCDKEGAKSITKLPYKISNTELSVYDRNYYNIVRSNKKECQEYGSW